MDFFKSRSNSSTSSQHSNSSHKSHASSSNNGASYNLEYCTSSSSLSPFATNTSSIGAASCPSSSAKTIVNVAMEDLFLSITNSNSSASHISASSSCSPRTLITVSKLSSSSHNNNSNNAKRKRRSSASLDDRDPELGFEPSAKRQQRLPSLYQSDAGSVVSSVYPSPVDETLVNEIDTRSSSECLSTATDYEVTHDDIPDSPSSLRPDIDETHEDLHNRSHSEEHDGDGHEDEGDDEEDDDEEDHITDDDDVHDIISNCSTASRKTTQIYNPVGSGVTVCVEESVHHGERTPGHRLSTSKSQSSSSSAAGETSSHQQPKVKSFDDYLSTNYDCMTPAADPEPQRLCPLPALSWANAQDVWQLMCKKDEQASCLRNPSMLDYHPGLQPRMRAILLDWLIEVCEVYKLHRETYYLAVDYLDRYLSAQKNVQKTHLQLIGITCLFVAAKVEEIYPPKIGEFAYVTDGACQESDILQHEILLLQALEWNISPVTAIGWLGVYMQLNVNNRTPASFQTSQRRNKRQPSTTAPTSSSSTSCYSIDILNRFVRSPEVDDAFIYPQFSGLEFVQTAQLLDLCSLDVGVGNFPYSVIAASAISHTFNRETALRCSGLEWNTIQPCARWMQPFFEVISEESHNLHLLEQNEQISTKFGLGHICPNIVTDESHIIQTHTTTMTMFDRACLLQEQLLAMASKIKQEASPATGLMCPDGLLTPPASSRKSLDCIVEELHHLHSVIVNENRDGSK
ncbi:G1/S-specific cyclin-E isoform X1 [Stomoxys calcitrans]|uniref:G1/S-specific cyclin-E isoform X1 n=2 Tax=Stomoxys calcitrans TaxID=35570 RepID=UPI0027E28D2C|nr:G1/S-specific cyclin-E isoform X1 [Stomoxys calcitrans]XP_013116503.2 G1/S-specific cyclin-E isoform X1 [Stomoxys calcitrans]XP_059220594.1 G1/S-specific cyclin-E isoform X1 [Stomoxys calcitrans]